MAIAMNRVDFVNLFLSYGISIQSILTPQVLEFLYGYLCQNSHSILNLVLKKEYEPASGIYKDVMQLLCSYEKYDDKKISISLTKIKSVIKDACSVFMKQRNDQFIEVLFSNNSIFFHIIFLRREFFVCFIYSKILQLNTILNTIKYYN